MTRNEFLEKCNRVEMKTIFNEIDLMLLAETNPNTIFKITVKTELASEVVKELQDRGFFVAKNHKLNLVTNGISFSAYAFRG